jgi:hypothetical protein
MIDDGVIDDYTALLPMSLYVTTPTLSCILEKLYCHLSKYNE